MPINSFLYPGAKVTPAYEVANSCRFNDGDSAFITRANAGSDGTTDTWTMSMWVKRGVLGTTQFLFHGYTSGNFNVSLRFTSDDQLYFFQEDHPAQNGRLLMTTARKFRDPSSWLHIVAQYDSTQSTNTNRAKIYINGVQETTFNGSVTWPDQNFDSEMTSASTNIHIGKENGGDYFDGYMAEVVLLDGTAASPTSFGEYDEDSPTIFKPKDVSGLTFGTHGFYLDFEDSSNLGNDVNGGTDFTENNLAATDQATDSPTNNFATLNPLGNYVANGVFTEGNLVMTTATNGHLARGISTIRPAHGKWYAECKVLDSDRFSIGFMNGNETYSAQGGEDTNSVIVFYSAGAYTNGSTSADYFGSSLSDNDIIMLAMDLDNDIAFMGVNGTWAKSATEAEIEAGTATNSLTTHISSTVPVNTGHCGMFIEDNSGSEKMSGSFNFGNPAHSISSGNSDENGYGNFEYSVPDGFLALCTKNLGSDGG